MRYKTNLQIQDCLNIHKKPNQIFQPKADLPGIRQFALCSGTGVGAEVTQWGWESIASLRLLFASVCSYFPRLQCSHTADSKTLENHLKLVSCFVKLYFV